MAKSKNFQVTSKRILFKCFECGAKRSMPIGEDLRRKNIRCHKCKAITKCLFNRRCSQREFQNGKASLITLNGQELGISLQDYSAYGIGFDLDIGAVRSHSIKIGQMVKFKCSWNPRLIDHGLFVIKNIKDRRIGVEKRDRKLFI